RGANGVGDFLNRSVFCDEPRTPGFDRAHEHGLVVERCDHDDLRLGDFLLDAFGRVRTVTVGQAVVHQNDIGTMELNGGAAFVDGGGSRDHVDRRVRTEYHRETLDEHLVVVDDHDSYRCSCAHLR